MVFLFRVEILEIRKLGILTGYLIIITSNLYRKELMKLY